MSSQGIEFRMFNKADFKAFFICFATPILGVLIFLMLWNILAFLIAIPIGIVAGLSKTVYVALNPLVRQTMHGLINRY